jgi:hypothetical protein
MCWSQCAGAYLESTRLLARMYGSNGRILTPGACLSKGPSGDIPWRLNDYEASQRCTCGALCLCINRDGLDENFRLINEPGERN